MLDVPLGGTHSRPAIRLAHAPVDGPSAPRAHAPHLPAPPSARGTARTGTAGWLGRRPARHAPAGRRGRRAGVNARRAGVEVRHAVGASSPRTSSHARAPTARGTSGPAVATERYVGLALVATGRPRTGCRRRNSARWWSCDRSASHRADVRCRCAGPSVTQSPLPAARAACPAPATGQETPTCRQRHRSARRPTRRAWARAPTYRLVPGPR